MKTCILEPRNSYGSWHPVTQIQTMWYDVHVWIQLKSHAWITWTPMLPVNYKWIQQYDIPWICRSELVCFLKCRYVYLAVADFYMIKG